MQQWTSRYENEMQLPSIMKVEVLKKWEWVETEYLTTLVARIKPDKTNEENIRITIEKYKPETYWLRDLILMFKRFRYNLRNRYAKR